MELFCCIFIYILFNSLTINGKIARYYIKIKINLFYICLYSLGFIRNK